MLANGERSAARRVPRTANNSLRLLFRVVLSKAGLLTWYNVAICLRRTELVQFRTLALL